MIQKSTLLKCVPSPEEKCRTESNLFSLFEWVHRTVLLHSPPAALFFILLHKWLSTASREANVLDERAYTFTQLYTVTENWQPLQIRSVGKFLVIFHMHDMLKFHSLYPVFFHCPKVLFRISRNNVSIFECQYHILEIKLGKFNFKIWQYFKI